MQSSDNQNGPAHGPRTPGSDPAHAYARATNTASAYPEAATDFLGLDQDVSSTAPDAHGAAPAGGALDTSSSWLLSIEEGGAPATETAPSSTPGSFTAGQATVDGPERMLEPEWQTSAEPARAANDGETAPQAPPARKSRSYGLIFALAACALLTTGGWYGWQWWQARQRGADTEVARTPTPRTPPAAQPKTPRAQAPAPVNTAPAPADPALATQPAPADPAPVNVTTPETATATTTTSSAPVFEFGPRSTDARVEDFLRTQQGQGLPTDDASAPSTIRPDVALFGPGAGGLPANDRGEVVYDETSYRSPSPTQRTTQRTQGRGTLRIATAGDLAGVWDGSTIPLDAVEKDAKLLTPQIGRVRATIYGGEIFEGRLYAVGQKQFYLDTELGRMALLSTQVAKIEQLSSPDGTAALGAAGSQYLNGLPRVRVRTPGGMLYGKIIGRDETSLTLITDGGARIRVDATDFEPAPDTNAVIVRSSRRASP